MQALFLLKQRPDPYGYGDYTSEGYDTSSYSSGYTNYQAATGMWTSTQMVLNELTAHGISGAMELVVDGNGIDAICTNYNPEMVFIEGLWVTPDKLSELIQIPAHAARTWVVRIHSDLPFLASEGVAFSWFKGYLTLGVKIAPNSRRLYRELKVWMQALGYTNESIQENLIFLPNCYPTDFPQIHTSDFNFDQKDTIDIGCFGAIRIMKNTLMQANNAIEFAAKIGKRLRWHFNENIGSGGHGPYANMVAMLEGLPNVEIVPHTWEDRETFLESLKSIDLLLQTSLSETMNIVAADATYVGRPIIVSDEISWAFPLYGDPTNGEVTVSTMSTVYSKPAFFVQANREGLRAYAQTALVIWVRLFVPEPASQIMTNPAIIPNTQNNTCCGG